MTPPIIRGLTLWRPWSAAIVHGPKRVENRPWFPSLSFLDRGLWIAIHAGRRWDADGAELAAERWGKPYKADETTWPEILRAEGLIGVARVVEVRALDEVRSADAGWAVGPWCWILDNVRALAKPIPCRGAQGLWTLPPEALAVLEPLCVEPAP